MATTKVQRTVRVLCLPNSTCLGCVRITEGKKVDEYEFEEIPAAWGRGFRVQKTRGKVNEPFYNVNLDGANSTCDCRGHLAHGHCRHASFLTALVRERKI